MKNHKVRREGKASSALHAMEISEFVEIVKRCQRLLVPHLGRYIGVVYFLFQFHMIARNDVVEHFKYKDFTAKIEFP